jgi:Primase C terminal 2 (PriCT-2)
MKISTKIQEKENSNNVGGVEMDNQIEFQFSVNRSGKNKDFNKEDLTTDFKTTSGTLEDVRSEVSKGYALCAGILKEGTRRLADNIIGSNWVLIDIDNKGYSTDSNGNRLDKDGKITQIRKVNPKTGKETFSWVTLSDEPSFKVNDEGHKIPCIDAVEGVQRKPLEVCSHSPFTIEQALENPFIKEFGAIIYTTPSHTPNWHKFRIVLMLPEFVEAEALKLLIKRLIAEFPEADKACSDISRVFYGNTEAEFPLFNPDAYLPMEWVKEARKQAKKVSEVKSSKPIKKNSKNNEYEINRLWGALEHLDSDEYNTWIKYGMCLQSAEKPGMELENSPEFQIWCDWSSGSPKYGLDGLDVCREKWSTFSADEGLELGSIFYDAVENGWIDPIGKKGVDPYLQKLRVAPDDVQYLDFWFNPEGKLYSSLNREGLAIRPNILNGNLAAYNLISAQLGGILSPKLDCKMLVDGSLVKQRGGGHILAIGTTGDGKSVITNLIKETTDGISIYANCQADFINQIAAAMVCHIENLCKAKKDSMIDTNMKAMLQNELLICKSFSRVVREGAQSTYISGGNAVAFSAHSAASAKVYRESKDFWRLYEKYKEAMKNIRAYHHRYELHNPGMVMYNRDAISEMEKLLGTDFAPSGAAIGLILAGFSTEDTCTYSRGNNANGGSGNAGNNLTRFSICALTQPEMRKAFIGKDIAMGNSKYGMAPRICFLYLENTERESEEKPIIEGTIAGDLKSDFESDHKHDVSNPFSINISEAIQRICNTIARNHIEGEETLSVPVVDCSAVIYKEFLEWVDEVDPVKNRYSKDRKLKFSQHFTKMCLNAWMTDLVDESIGKTQDEVEILFKTKFKDGITKDQACRTIALMKQHYIEHMIDGISATDLLSLNDLEIEGKVKDFDSLKAICENKNTLLQWFGNIKGDKNKPLSKIIEESVSKSLLNQFKRLIGKTLASVVGDALKGKEPKITFPV